jgi:small subunit ribosomal protein S21
MNDDTLLPYLSIRSHLLLFINSILAPSSATELSVKIKVNVGDGEPIESALRRFKREVNKSGHMMELRHRRQFENSQDKIKRKKKEAGMRRKYERMARKRMQRV